VWHDADVIVSTLDTPFGLLGLGSTEDGTLLRVGLPGLSAPMEGRRSDRVLAPVRRALDRYLAGEAVVWDFAVSPGGSPFQQRVWAALATIPYATTSSYGEVARMVGCVGAARAVGAANRSNPVPIVIPCHRVIGADGSLTGYAGRQGLGIKRFLLDVEAGTGRLAGVI
jgi:methylated-DNA-[protein]-cysteine S-methyltransferase